MLSGAVLLVAGVVLGVCKVLVMAVVLVAVEAL